MRKPTELMEKILTSNEARRIIDYMSPIYGEAYVFLYLIQAISVALDEGENAIGEFLKQIVPQTATWFLEYWGKEYDVLLDPSWDLEQRRGAVISAMRYKAPINPTKMENIISALLGLDIKIAENTGKNKFSVYVKGYIEDTSIVTKAIERAKPAHLIYDILVADYEEVEITTYGNAIITEQENVQINVL